MAYHFAVNTIYYDSAETGKSEIALAGAVISGLTAKAAAEFAALGAIREATPAEIYGAGFRLEPVAEEPVVEPEPVAEEPVVEPEPVAEEPVVEPEPVAEEPVVVAPTPKRGKPKAAPAPVDDDSLDL